MVWKLVVLLVRTVTILTILMIILYFLFLSYSFGIALQKDTNTNGFHEEERAHQATKLSKHGFVLPLMFNGQLVAGIQGITSLQCWLKSLSEPMVLVEPYVVNSSLTQDADTWKLTAAPESSEKHRPLGSKPNPTPLLLSNYFELNDYLQLGGKLPFVKLERLWNEAPRSVIVVEIKGYKRKQCLAYNQAKCPTKQASHEDIDYYTSGCPLFENVESSLVYMKSQGFKVVRTVCLNCDRKLWLHLPPSELTKHIFGEFRPSEVTLVIGHWKFSYKMSLDCGISCTPYQRRDLNVLAHLSPNPKLVKQAKSYLKPLRGNSQTKVIAVMIRIEWLLILMNKNVFETAKSCLSKLLQEYMQLLSTLPSTRTVLTLDIGKYGSGTFDTILSNNNISKDLFSEIVQEIKHFVTQVNVDYDEWEESFGRVLLRNTGTSDYLDRGYLALFQNVIASQADYVLRLGGGHYQALALHLFRRNHPDVELQHHIKEVCTTYNMTDLGIK